MSNIILEFKKNDLVISQDRLTLVGEDDAIILHTYFVMPVRFATKKTEFFGLLQDPWLSIPLLHFATVGYDQIKKTYNGISSEYIIPDVGYKLIFSKQNEQIQVISTINHKIDSVEANELLSAFYHFSLEIKTMLQEDVPELLLNDYWNKWIKSG